MAAVDNLKEETQIKGLDKENNYGVSANLTSVVLVGGMYQIYYLLKNFCTFKLNRKNTYIFLNFFFILQLFICILTYLFRRIKLRRKTARGQIHYRIVRGMY